MQTLREWWHRFRASFRGGRSDGDLEQELRLHLELEGRGTAGLTQAIEAARDQRGFPWIDAIRADVVFGIRQLVKHRIATIAAILSLGLAIGATGATYRLVDAILIRPLPVTNPDRLFAISTTFLDAQDRTDESDDFDYPTYRRYSQLLDGHADLLLVGMVAPLEVSFGGDPERVRRQYVSGNVFPVFGLQPALGRLIGPADDDAPGAHAVAVLTHHYWTRRFGADQAAVGRSIGIGGREFRIIGVTPRGFTGTEPGAMTDIFLPATMNIAALDSPGWSWFRMWTRARPGVTAAEVEDRLQAAFTQQHVDHLKDFPPDMPKARIAAYLSERVRLHPAGAGASPAKRELQRPLWILAALVALVLLIACANVANLLIAQGAARQREMALRLSIGAGRRRLVQLVLVESALLAIAACAVGVLFAAWSTPFVVSLLAPAEAPIELVLDFDWRTLLFGLILACGVTALFGLAPAWRAAAVLPSSALRGHAAARPQRRLAHGLVAAQMAFCLFVLSAATLFIGTFARLSSRPLGFSADPVAVIDAEARGTQPVERWVTIADRLRAIDGVARVAVAGWALLSENRWTAAVTVSGRAAPSRSPYFLNVSPGFFDVLQIRFVAGRDFRPGDRVARVEPQRPPVAGVGIVNEAFARAYFDGENPVGRTVGVRIGGAGPPPPVDAPMEIVGLVGDAAYSSVREPMRPTVYVPLEPRDEVTMLARTAGDPMSVIPAIRQATQEIGPGIRLRAAGLQSALVRRQMVRERLLATLSFFFGALALLLCGIGLAGMLHHAVIQQRRDIGVRMALGASGARLVRQLFAGVAKMISIGCVAGIAGGILFGRVAEGLLFDIRATDVGALATPLAILAAAAVLATLGPAMRAVRIDPIQTLKSD